MLEMFGIMTDTQATDVVTFDVKGTGVRCVVCGTIDYQMNFFLVHNVSKCSRFLMIIVVMECRHTCEIDRHKRQADITLLFEYIKPLVGNPDLSFFLAMILIIQGRAML